jgi:uncharacterized protein
MRDNILRELVAQLSILSMERISFCWQGGEPTLAGLDYFKRAMKYQSLFKIPGQIVENSLQTNGILIDKKWAKFLARHRFLVGVSLDGPKEIHNYYRRDQRGRGSYDRVLEGIELLKKYHVEFNILVLLNNLNIKQPKKLYHFLLDQGFQYLQFIPCLEKDPKTKKITKYSITPEEYGHFLCKIFDEWIKDDNPRVYIRGFEESLIAYVTGETPTCTFSSECGKYIIIEHNGDIYPCDFFVDSKWLLGNLTSKPINKIIKNGKYKEFRLRKNKKSENCVNCSWIKNCNSGCPKHWIKNANHSYFCQSYKMYFKYTRHKFLKLKKFTDWKIKNHLII